MIRLRLLGCNGGIGGMQRQTTCYLLGDSVLVDAGTGLGTLPLDEMLLIDHIVLTHAHLDHIACLPLLVDSVAGRRNAPLQVWALPEVVDILATHIFNDKIWPDFTKIPSAEQPFMTLHPLPHPLEIAGLSITPLPARHGIPACGLRVQKDGISIAFSGDTADCGDFWEALAQDTSLGAVIVECSYPSSQSQLAEISMHMEASDLAGRLAALPQEVAAIVVHRKPGLEEDIATELQSRLAGRDLRLPRPGDEYRFD